MCSGHVSGGGGTTRWHKQDSIRPSGEQPGSACCSKHTGHFFHSVSSKNRNSSMCVRLCTTTPSCGHSKARHKTTKHSSLRYKRRLRSFGVLSAPIYGARSRSIYIDLQVALGQTCRGCFIAQAASSVLQFGIRETPKDIKLKDLFSLHHWKLSWNDIYVYESCLWKENPQISISKVERRAITSLATGGRCRWNSVGVTRFSRLHDLDPNVFGKRGRKKFSLKWKL